MFCRQYIFDGYAAILLALAHPDKVTIQGITTVAGNSTVENVTENIRKVLDYIGASIPVAQGCARPLRREPEPQPMAHGKSGMDGPVLPAPTSRLDAPARPDVARQSEHGPDAPLGRWSSG